MGTMELKGRFAMRKPLCFWIGAAIVLLTLATSLPTQAKTPRPAATITDSALIINSGSGRLPGYRIRVTASGRLSSVTVLRDGRASGGRTGQLAPAVTRRFFSDLAQAGSLSALPVMQNADNSASATSASGVRLFIRYHGGQSPQPATVGQRCRGDVVSRCQTDHSSPAAAVPDTP